MVRWLLFVLLAAAVLRMAVVAPLYLLDDEAYYWVWSRNLALSYFDHPPMTAWMLAGFNAVFGDGLLAVRLPAILSVLVASWAGVCLTAKIYKAPAVSGHYLFMTVVAALFFGTAMVMAPDAPMTLFTALTLYFFYRAVFEDSRGAWYATGVFFGMALLSKYIAILWGLALAAFLFSSPAQRRQLKTAPPWIAVGLALLVFSPVLVWNAQHDWASFRFQLGHGLPSGKEGNVPAYFGSQAGLVTPGVFLVLLAVWGASLRRWRALPDAQRFLVLTSLLPFLFFIYAATKAPVSANWPAFAYFTGLMLVAAWHAGAGRGWRRGVVWLNYGLMTLLIAVIVAQAHWRVLPLDKRDPAKRYHGWPEMLAKLETVAERYPGALLVGNNYQVQSQLAYHFKTPQLPALNIDSRHNQFDYFDRGALAGRDLLIVDKAYSLEPFAPYFDSVERLATFTIHWRGIPARHLSVVLGKNYRPGADGS